MTSRNGTHSGAAQWCTMSQNAAIVTGTPIACRLNDYGEVLNAMPGLRTQTGWLSTVRAADSSDNVPLSSQVKDPPEPPEVLGVRGGPRLARAILLAVLCSYVSVQVINELTSPFPAHGLTLAVDIIALTVVFALTVYVTSAIPERWPMWRRLAILTATGLATYIPLVILGKQWAGMAGFFAGSTLLLLSGWMAWAVFAASIGSMLIYPIAANLGPYLTAYLTVATLVTGLVVFGLARLSLVIRYVHSTRGELAQLAIINERMRFARDLHDLLGYSLSAITLKAELTRRLVASNPARARDELAEVLDISRQALADVRLVASGYRNISLAKEASSVTSLLATAGITAQVEIDCGALDERVDTVLATVLREAVTNMLRHSGAQNCNINASQADNIIRLRVANDGVLRSAAAGRRGGGLENLAARLEAVGGSLTAKVRGDGWFDLLAEAPASAPAADDQFAEAEMGERKEA
jgi:two-component system, NarL family, sensor histidine kinase DesK